MSKVEKSKVESQFTGGIAEGTAGSLDGHETSARGEALQKKFGTRAFLEAGKANGKTWFEISPRTRQYMERLKGGKEMLETIQQTMDQLNAFLARPDVSDELKMKLLQQFLGAPTDEYDDVEDLKSDEQWKGMGTVLAEAMVGDPATLPHVFGALIKSDGREIQTSEGTNVMELGAMQSSLIGAWTDAMNDNKIAPEPDKSAAYLAKLTLAAEADARRRQGLSGSTLVEDIRASRRQQAQEIEARKREYADKD